MSSSEEAVDPHDTGRESSPGPWDDPDTSRDAGHSVTARWSFDRMIGPEDHGPRDSVTRLRPLSGNEALDDATGSDDAGPDEPREEHPASESTSDGRESLTCIRPSILPVRPTVDDEETATSVRRSEPPAALSNVDPLSLWRAGSGQTIRIPRGPVPLLPNRDRERVIAIVAVFVAAFVGVVATWWVVGTFGLIEPTGSEDTPTP